MFPPGRTIRRALASRTTTPATVTNHLVRCSRSVIISPYVLSKASLLGRRTYLNARYNTENALQSTQAEEISGTTLCCTYVGRLLNDALHDCCVPLRSVDHSTIRNTKMLLSDRGLTIHGVGIMNGELMMF
jgi:hypothetical protein